MFNWELSWPYSSALVFSSSFQKNLDPVEAATSSLGTSTPPPAAELVLSESKDVQELLPGRMDIDSVENMERGGEQTMEEVLKKGSSIRFRKKNKRAKEQHSKGWYYPNTTTGPDP